MKISICKRSSPKPSFDDIDWITEKIAINDKRTNRHWTKLTFSLTALAGTFPGTEDHDPRSVWKRRPYAFFSPTPHNPFWFCRSSTQVLSVLYSSISDGFTYAATSFLKTYKHIFRCGQYRKFSNLKNKCSVLKSFV